MINNIVTQKLRNFTVQIRPANSESIVGTGVAVSADGKVVTCAHVVKSAGVEPRALNGKELSVYFPQALGGEKKERRAKVIAFFPDFDDDVVLLQLTDGNAPLGPELIPVLGTAEKSQGNAFRSYGYRRLEDYIAGWADGKIQGHVDPPPKRKVQEEPVQLESNQINRGMSGSAVLDIDRNLVVGIVSETWFPDRTGKDSDTAWAVDSRVLSLAPLGLNVQDASHPYKPAPEPKTDIAAAQAAVFIKEKYSWNSAPSVLTEWTGRDDLLAEITTDWNDSTKHVTGLIGFGGEGKSSLARKWVDDLCRGEALLRPYGDSAPDGLFWWGFYENRSIDEFLEAALKYLSGGKIDPRAVPSSSLRAQIIGAMLGAGRYLFVLDGLEVMQHQEGDQYGLLQSADLRDLLSYFANPNNSSFCLITSRAPLLDLMEYTTYTHRDVDRLSDADGILLLDRLGVNGSQEQKSKVVSDWDGHALTISLLGSYLAEKYSGDIAHLADIPIPTADEPRYEHVRRVLRRYDENLTSDEREFLKLFSVFRLPVKDFVFEKVFVPLLKSFDKDALIRVISRLASYRLIHHDEYEKSYATHPLIRSYYLDLFTKGDIMQVQAIHEFIAYFYRSTIGETQETLTLVELLPIVEAIHHFCCAGNYSESVSTYYLYRLKFISQFSAWQTVLKLLEDFFSEGDITKYPLIENQADLQSILFEVGLCLTNLGYPLQALMITQNLAEATLNFSDQNSVSAVYRNVGNLMLQLGRLASSFSFGEKAFDSADSLEDDVEEWNSLTFLGWVAHLQGDSSKANILFHQAKVIQSTPIGYFDEEVRDDIVQANINTLPRHFDRDLGVMGYVYRADQLCKLGNITTAWHGIGKAIEMAKRQELSSTVSRCYRIVGDLHSQASETRQASEAYDIALKIARSVTVRDNLIEALLAHGRFLAKTSKVLKNNETSEVYLGQAFTDLNEALNYAVEGGYRIYEADIRVALAWAHLNSPRPLAGEGQGVRAAKAEAERALQMSQEMGYHWGKVDAEEVLKRMKAEG